MEFLRQKQQQQQQQHQQQQMPIKMPPPAATTVSTATTTTTTSSKNGQQQQQQQQQKCYHGSTAEDFCPNSVYQKSLDRFALSFAEKSFKKDESVGGILKKQGSINARQAMMDFATNHKELMVDPKFSGFLFASCTQSVLDANFDFTPGPIILKLRSSLILGFTIKYHCIPAVLDIEEKNDDPDFYDNGSYCSKRFEKYTWDSITEKGLLNCLTHETKDICDCMESKNNANGARQLEKVKVLCEKIGSARDRSQTEYLL